MFAHFKRRVPSVLAMLLSCAAAVAAPESVTYIYDELGRLKEVNDSSAAHVDYSYDAAGNRTSANYSPPDTTPPSAPGIPTITNLTYKSATANWTAATDNIAVTQYEWRLNSGAWTSIAATPNPSVPLTGLSSLTLYTFEVRALDGAYNPGPATSKQFTTPAPQPGTLSFSPLTYSVLEDNTNVTVTVTRTSGTDFPVSVVYETINGTAIGGDYTATLGTLNWADGQGGGKTFTVAINEDTNHESNETISLVLSNPTNGASIGGNGTITINDDEPGVLSIGSASYSVAENAGSVTITVTRSLASYGAVSVQYATANSAAVAPGDYTANSGTLSWASGDSATKTVVVPVIDDTTPELDETFTFTLSNVVGGAPIAISPATVTILGNDSSIPATPAKPTSNDNPSYDGSYIISWVAVSGADHYVLEEAGDSAFTSPLSWMQTGTSKQRTGMTAADYYYHVKACNSLNQCSAYSPARLQVVCTGGCN